VVAPVSKWKEKGHESEVLMAGCSPTSCSPNLHLESGADVEERFLIIRWMMDRQSGKSEISQPLEITNRHHAGAGTRQAMKPPDQAGLGTHQRESRRSQNSRNEKPPDHEGLGTHQHESRETPTSESSKATPSENGWNS